MPATAEFTPATFCLLCRHAINIGILELREVGMLHKLEQRWWYDKGECGADGSVRLLGNLLSASVRAPWLSGRPAGSACLVPFQTALEEVLFVAFRHLLVSLVCFVVRLGCVLHLDDGMWSKPVPHKFVS